MKVMVFLPGPVGYFGKVHHPMHFGRDCGRVLLTVPLQLVEDIPAPDHEQRVSEVVGAGAVVPAPPPGQSLLGLFVSVAEEARRDVVDV